MESFQVLVTASHHATINVLEPDVVRQRKQQADGNEQAVAQGVAKECREGECQGNGYEEHDEFDDELQGVLEVSLACDLIVERQRLFVIDCQLEEDAVFGT